MRSDSTTTVCVEERRLHGVLVVLVVLFSASLDFFQEFFGYSFPVLGPGPVNILVKSETEEYEVICSDLDLHWRRHFDLYHPLYQNVEEGAAIAKPDDRFVGLALLQLNILVEMLHGVIVKLFRLLLKKLVVFKVVSNKFQLILAP